MKVNKEKKPDWNPRSEEVLKDQLTAYDEMREHCPVAYSEFMQWSVFRYEDVFRVINNHKTFSNAVSQHLSVPGGMDPPEHTNYRRIINQYFTQERMDAFEPICRKIVIDLVSYLLERGDIELMANLALPFAVRVQCAFLGWPMDLQKPLTDWTNRNYEATFAQDRQAMSDIAREFESIVDNMCAVRIDSKTESEKDVTTSLMHKKIWGRLLSNEEIASILRTWTVGEIGSIASSVGILVHYLAKHSELQKTLRSKPSLMPPAIDEILRIQGPLVSSRRITTCPVEISGRKIYSGEHISLNWISANRDGNIFKEPSAFRLDRDPDKNLLFGKGIHVCPGAPLARMEMRVVLEELLRSTSLIQLLSDRRPVKARYPASGFAILPIHIH